MTKRKYDTDKISAALVFIFSSVFLWQLKYIHSPLDVIFPRTILIGMIVLSIILFIKSVMKPNPESVKDLFAIHNRGKLIVGVIGTVLWLILIPFIGFGITSAIALMVLSILLGKESDRTPKKFASTVVVSALIVFVVYYFFSEFM
ncbi:MAG TPA: tripartite tricarboxylate transporter TctB family protein, partial [Thermodesulfobacteriota bacterium]|nr:tripartite tricarboxylate transporter TctB family protein [Thermodesulfobacteriota bacterium]